MISAGAALFLSGFLFPSPSVLEGMEIKNATFEGWLRDSRGIKTLETSYEAKMVVQTDVSASTVVFNKGTAYEKGNYSMQEGDVKMSDMAVMTILMPILTN